ncbi:uncharacterized protein N7469_011408 [Penicillium citrinum]|uniref:Zn(2)-C6 fungal-type domain-containing protein n=1 Tax=Penicillium citrinum TaxID=5077 RepID=A0A9W9NDC4_PENCI|nr:uncharacterized protein N7469_011408 [Penicillium citrinum]KAJ5217783.1 hypothetical protein N7469_011408 [Penicillium citrinum]
MRQTLRRSCAACAKLKHSCDLKLPRCSRCIKRKVLCVYANEPLAAPVPAESNRTLAIGPRMEEGCLSRYNVGSFDPFDSYPPTRLPREQVQRLIYSFLHKIAFQYYPLDLEPISNPFLISWWPLALGDPALFHVSLQTACLDEERAAQKGFQSSEILMADSVALLRRKINSTSLAVQDGTMNSVITLATIEFGKGNHEASRMHIEGVKQLVCMRGGINSVRQTSPLTARMISWVSMLVMGHPQFETQDDIGVGDGIPPIPEWQIEATSSRDSLENLIDMEISDDMMNVLNRLHKVFQRANRVSFTNTQLHDLTCYVVHRLLLSTPDAWVSDLSPMTESIRYTILLYLFIVQGPTYYSHAVMLNTLVTRLIQSLQQLQFTPHKIGSLDVWFTLIGMVASVGTTHYLWFSGKARELTDTLHIKSASEVLDKAKSFLWLDVSQGDYIFGVQCEAFANVECQSDSPVLSASTQISSKVIELL